jgi:hypothetical protein
MGYGPGVFKLGAPLNQRILKFGVKNLKKIYE